MAKGVFIAPYDDYALGLRIMAACLEHRGHQVDLIFFKRNFYHPIPGPNEKPLNYENYENFTLRGSCYDVNPWSQVELKLLRTTVRELAPDIIGLGSRSFFDDFNADILRQLKADNPQALVLAGGYGPMLNPDKYLETCDAVVYGEGEETIVRIADALDDGLDIWSIDNLVYLKDGRPVWNPVRGVSDIDSLPAPKFHQDHIRYIENNKLYESDPAGDIYYCLVGRGCAGACTYCTAGQVRSMYKQRGYLQKKRRYRTVEKVIDELRRAKAHGIRYVSFMDSYFVAPRDYLLSFLEICSAWKKKIHDQIKAQLPDFTEIP